jgi:signal transduction histidine kinase
MFPADLTTDDLIALNRQATVARLLSALAHDVNNALQVISGSVELLQGRSGLDEPLQIGLERIGGQVSALAGAVAAVTAFSQQAQSEVETSVSIGATVLRAVALRRTAIGRTSIALTVDAGGAGEVRVRGRAPHVLLAVLNLVHRAEQTLFRRPGAQLTVRAYAEGADAVVRIEDNGPAIPSDDRARLFEPFASTGSRPEVLGLGLPVSALIARAHGGSLTLEPLDAGSRFELRLPRIVA